MDSFVLDSRKKNKARHQRSANIYSFCTHNLVSSVVLDYLDEIQQKNIHTIGCLLLPILILISGYPYFILGFLLVDECVLSFLRVLVS